MKIRTAIAAGAVCIASAIAVSAPISAQAEPGDIYQTFCIPTSQYPVVAETQEEVDYYVSIGGQPFPGTVHGCFNVFPPTCEYDLEVANEDVWELTQALEERDETISALELANANKAEKIERLKARIAQLLANG